MGGRVLAATTLMALVAATPRLASAEEPPAPSASAAPLTSGDPPQAPTIPQGADANSGVAARRSGPASPEPTNDAADAALSRIVDRPHTIAELGAGILALPTAPISAGQSGGSTPFGTIGRGDATLLTGLHVLYRWNREFAAGAGVLYAPFPTTDSEYGGLRALPRTHTRSYFFIGGEGRYIPVHYRFLEAWVGLSLGAVIIADRFTTDAGDQVAPIIGTKEVTVRTEGFAFGVQFGGSYFISESWIAGINFRADRWILPEQPRCSSIGDCATLSGTVEALQLGLTIGYRLPL